MSWAPAPPPRPVKMGAAAAVERATPAAADSGAAVLRTACRLRLTGTDRCLTPGMPAFHS